MSSEKLSIPDLTQEEQDIFHNAFNKDRENLKTNAAISSSFCDIFVTICKMPSLSILTNKEAQNILELSDLNSKREALLTCADEKGSRALVGFYLLLHMNDQAAYGKLPSCQENDEKMTLLSKLRNKSLENKVAEISKTLIKHRSQGATKPVASIAAIRPHISRDNEDPDISADAKENAKWEQNYKDNEDDEDDKPPAYDTVITTEKQPLKPYRGRWSIKKDDVFFHFITLCFAMGTVLVVEHKLSDWTVSAGVGLISFAILEAIGIYFNFVNRVRSVARAIIRFTVRWAEKFPLALKNR